MPPKLRSHSSRSRHTGSMKLPTLEEGLQTLEVDDVGPPSSEFDLYDPDAERREAEGIENRTTPKSRKKAGSNISTSQRINARDADPNEGRCLITNRPIPVELCHLVPSAIKRETLRQLEYVWEIEYPRFNVDTRYNMFHLRADWHAMFDDSKWILVPELNILEDLENIYVADDCSTSNLAERFENQTFKYYVVPVPSFNEVICRFPDVDSHEHDSYPPPYSKLGALTSHIQPHYVIFNAGQKLATRKIGARASAQMRGFLSKTLVIPSSHRSPLDYIQVLYSTWMETTVPSGWRARDTLPNSPGEEGQDDPSQPRHRQRREGLRSSSRSEGQGSRNSTGRYHGGQQRAIHPAQFPEDHESVTEGTVVEDDTEWIEYIHKWQKQNEGGDPNNWEPDGLSDGSDAHLSEYNNEHTHTPPPPGVWHKWRPAWDNRNLRYPSRSDRSRFSSNDWAMLKSNVNLTRPVQERPETTF